MVANQQPRRPAETRCPYADLCETVMLSELAEGSMLIIPLEDRRCRADDPEQHRQCAVQLGLLPGAAAIVPTAEGG